RDDHPRSALNDGPGIPDETATATTDPRRHLHRGDRVRRRPAGCGARRVRHARAARPVVRRRIRVMAQTTGRIESINTSRGGVPKEAAFGAFVTVDGIDGDRQRDRRLHGGPDRAVVIYSFDVIRALQAEGHPIASGTAGENLTISGVDWRLV